MPLFVLLCALIGAAFLLPLLPALIFVLLMVYGAVKLLEGWLTPSAPTKRGLSPKQPKPPEPPHDPPR